MSAELTPRDGTSPFDSIRQLTDAGREFWSARDLMPLLGYEKWERFADAINRAQVAGANSGHDMSRHMAAARVFPGAGKNLGGRPGEDRHLSRFACYLVAMNGDPRKAEIAAAQTYFAVKTREAEVAVPQTREQRLAIAFLDAQEIIEEKDQRIAQLEPSATAWDRLHELGADYEVDVAAKILSRDPAISIGRNRLFDFMHDQDWVFRGRHNVWKAYQDQVDNGRLKMRPGREYFHKGKGEYRTGDPTILITAKGLADLRQLLGGGAQLALVVSE